MNNLLLAVFLMSLRSECETVTINKLTQFITCIFFALLFWHDNSYKVIVIPNISLLSDCRTACFVYNVNGSRNAKKL